MQMPSISWARVFYAAGGFLGLYVLWVVLRSLGDVRRFRIGVTKLERGKTPEGDLFKSNSTLGGHANQFLQQFRDASDRNRLNRFDCERTLQPINTAFRSLSARPRALAGVLILAGLLITLFNLQFSVGRLGSVFNQLSSQVSQGPEASAPGSSVEQAMAGIADSARNAFLYSALVMSIAAIVLLLAVRVHRSGSAALLEFARWASDTQDDLLASVVPTDLDSTVARMSATVDRLDHMIAAVGEFGNAISSVKGFADEMSNASREIASAVQKLPENINSSIVHFSGNVARNISESLDHHVEYIEKLLVIYGDQKVRFEETHKFMAETLENAKKTAEGLAPLASVTDGLKTAAAEVGSLARAVEALDRTTRDLGPKIDGLPRENLRQLITDFESGLAEVQAIATELSASRDDASIAEAFSDLGETLAVKLEQMSDLVAKADSRGALAAILEQTSALRANLEQVMDLIAKRDSNGPLAAVRMHIRALWAKLDRVSHIRAKADSVSVATASLRPSKELLDKESRERDYSSDKS
jgi:hypothetical protein